jgi:hypothetical protein
LENEKIDHPQHYRSSSNHEAIDVIESWNLSFSLGNVIKYICRAGLKSGNSMEDLKKAKWYLDREISRRESQK